MSDQQDPPGALVLVLNAGSSSLKFALIDVASGSRVLSGLAERVGTPHTRLLVSDGRGAQDARAMPGAGHRDLVEAVLAQPALGGRSARAPVGVGHRVVHGGERFSESVLIDDDVLAAIEDYARLAPLHNPAALLGVEAARAVLPDAPQVAVFDTAFHHSMPPKAYRYAVPEDWYTRFGVRRYGFHGTSHRFVSGQAARLLGRPLEDLALVVAHLGNGCSATAVLGGLSVDTSMGLTPLEGLVMGTRSGDVDAAVFGYLSQQADLTVDEVTAALNSASGLLGLSGISNDIRPIEAAGRRGDERAALAMDVFGHRLAKTVAGLAVSLGRLDALVFTGGIGENSATVRRGVVDALGLLGLSLDATANDEHGRSTHGLVSAPGSGPAVLVVPTDEELLIAQDTARLVGAGADGPG